MVEVGIYCIVGEFTRGVKKSESANSNRLEKRNLLYYVNLQKLNINIIRRIELD